LRATGDVQGAGRAAGAAYVAAVVSGVGVAIVLALAAPGIGWMLGGRGAVLAGATGYLRASAVGLPLLYVSYAGNGHLTGLADTRTPLWIALGANALNVTLEAVFVYGARWGLAGSAWGTVLAQLAAAALYAAASWRGRAGVRPQRPGRAEMGELVRDGHRLSVRTIALGVVPMAVTAIAARLGPVALGGQQVAMRVWYLLSLLLDALAVPGQVYVSSALGAGDVGGARLVGRRTLWLGLVAGLGLCVITLALAFVVPPVFTRDPAVRHAATVGLAVAALTQPLAAMAFVLDGLILGLSDYVAMRRAMIVAAMVFAPFGALVLRIPWVGLPGVWAALGAWLAARAILLGGRWARDARSAPGEDPRIARAAEEHLRAEPVLAPGAPAQPAAPVVIPVNDTKAPSRHLACRALLQRVKTKRDQVPRYGHNAD
jgi:putative MATE family efflux protein